MYAKKSLGQHFLRSERALDKIIEAGKLRSTDTVLEIGPGEGVLTKRLLATGSSVLAVEKDDELFLLLKKKFSKELRQEKLILMHEDILKFDLLKPIAASYKLIANIPYNITGAILEKFLSSAHQPTTVVLLVQDEVAKRIVTRDGKESILSISVKAYGSPRYVEKVLAGSFAPRPEVNSAILAIEGISKDFFTHFSETFFFTLLKAGFKAKRKKLFSNLSSLFGKERVRETFEKLQLDENLRAEDVAVALWGQIAEALVI